MIATLAVLLLRVSYRQEPRPAPGTIEPSDILVLPHTPLLCVDKGMQAHRFY